MRPGLYRALFASTTGSSCITGGGLGNENPRKKAWVGRYNYIILSVLFLVIGRAEGAGKMCTPGQYLENGVCTECPPNTYAPSAGMVECIACPAPSKTLGAVGASTVGVCACPSGLYLDDKYFSCESCPSPRGFFFCPGGLNVQNESEICKTITEVQSGWWRPSGSWPAVYQKCPVENSCVGGCGECAEGHTGPLCQNCKEGLTRDFLSTKSLCGECPAYWKLLLIGLALTAALFLFVFIISAGLAAEAAQRLALERDRICLTPVIKQMLFFVSIWGSFGLMKLSQTTESNLAELSFDSSHTELVTESSSEWYNVYRDVARRYLTYLYAVASPDCWSSSWPSPIYAYTVVAFATPIVVILVVSVASNAYFLWKRGRIPADKRALLLTHGDVWRDVIGQRTTILFSRFSLVTLYIWLPAATTYFSAALPCMELATKAQVLKFDPSVDCGSAVTADAAQLAVLGLLFYSIGFPFVCFLTLVCLYSRRDSVRMIGCLGFIDDFFAHNRFWWESLRCIVVVSCISIPFHTREMAPATIATALISGYGLLTLYFKPYGSENKLSWSPFGQGSGKFASIRIPMTLQFREVFMCTILALALQFHTLYLSCSLPLLKRLFEVAVVLTFTLGQMAQAISVLYELYRLGWFYWLRLRRRKQDNWAGVEDATVITDTDGLLGNMKENMHKFSRSDETFFRDAVRLSPFPAEALAQLQTLATSQNFVSISVADAATWVFEKGHLEVQGQTLYASVPRMAAMYTDLTYDISTSDEFESEMQKMLHKVAVSLRVADEVKQRRENAKRAVEALGLRLLPGSRHRMESRSGVTPNANQLSWKNTLNVSTEADIALKWLEVQMQPPDEQMRVRRAEFVVVFPDAGGVERQIHTFEIARPLPEPRLVTRCAKCGVCGCGW